MAVYQWTTLGIGIAIIVLLSVIKFSITSYAKQSLFYLDLIRESTASCYSILKDINEERARKNLEERKVS